MRKRIMLLMSMFILSLVLIGCGNTTEETAEGLMINSAYSDQEMVTVAGEAVNMAEASFAVGSLEYGYAMLYPEEWKEIPVQNLELIRDGNICYIGYIPQHTMELIAEKDVESMSSEEKQALYAQVKEDILPFAALYAVDAETADEAGLTASYDNVESITEAHEQVYYFAYNEALSAEKLSDTDKKWTKQLVDSVEAMRDNIIIFPPHESDQAGFPGSLTEFTAEDMDGKKVDQSIFVEYDLTMVNIWSTWCGFCVEEIDELEELYQQLPENVNMITICEDAAIEKELAKEILSTNGASFQTLVGNDVLRETLMQYISGFPTTVFVDRDGNIVGQPQVGAPGSDVLTGYQQLIDDRLAMLNKNEGGLK